MARRVEVEIVGNAASLERAFGRARASAGGFERGVMQLNKAAGVALVGGLAYATHEAIKFQSAMEQISTQAGASQVEVNRLSKEVLKLAPAVGTSPQDLAKALYHVESAGVRGAKALSILRAAAEGAKVGHADLESVTNALVAAQRSGVKGAGSMTHAMGVLNATVGAGNMRMEDLAAAMSTGILASAKAFGVSIQEVGAALGTMTTTGMPAEEAATRLRMTLSLMAAPTSKASKALKEINLSQLDLANTIRERGLVAALELLKRHLDDSGKSATEQAQVISQAFGGGRTSAGILTLLQHVDDMHARLLQINKTTGDFGESWKRTTHTTEFELDKAKAAIQAAAIPIGDLLLPLLTKSAHAAEGFASALEAHLPQIRNDFESLAHVIGPLATGFGHIALSQPGIAAIAGSLAAIETAAVGMKLKRLGTGLGELGPIGVAAAVGIGIFTAAIILSGGHADVLTQAVNRARDAVEGLANTASTAADKHLALRQAQVNVKTSADAVRQAEEAYQSTLRKSGRSSEDTRVALHNLQAARVAHAQALHDEQRAAQQNSAAQVHNAAQIRAAKTQVAGLASAFRDAIANADPLTARSLAIGQHMGSASVQAEKFSRGMLHVANEAGAAAGKLSGINANAARVARQLQLAAKTASALAIALGRIPSRKEINVFIRTFEVGKQHTIGGRVIGRQAGGFIPGSGPVPITAHGGEIVLNPDQQQVLGGPRHLAQLFGFHGSRGPGSSMAAGGRVGHGHRASHLPSSIREAEAKAAGTPSLADDITAYSRELAWTNEQLGRRDLTGSERERLRVRRIRVQNRLGSLRRRQRVQNRRRSSDINLPSSIRLAEARARLTGTLDDDITAKGREVAWYQSELAKRPGRERRIALTNALADALDEYKSLLSERAHAGDDTGGGVDNTADLQAQLERSRAQTAAANEAARLQAAFIGTGVFAGGGGGTGGGALGGGVHFNFLIPDAEQIRRATEAIASGAGGQPYRTSSVVRTGY